MEIQPQGIKSSEARKRMEPEALRLPNPNDERKPNFVNHIMIAREARQAIIRGK